MDDLFINHVMDRNKSYLVFKMVNQAWKYVGVEIIHDHASLGWDVELGWFYLWF